MAYEPSEHLEHHEHVTETAAVGQPFGVSQAISLVLGIIFVVIGAVGLARTGVSSPTTHAAFVGPFRATPLLSFLHLAAGLFMLVGATSRMAARTVCMVAGPLLIAFGIIVLLQPINALGYRRANGVLYLFSGGIALAAALLTPVVEVARRDVTSTV